MFNAEALVAAQASPYQAGTCGAHKWGKDADGAMKCGQLVAYEGGDPHLNTYADDAASCCKAANAPGIALSIQLIITIMFRVSPHDYQQESASS